MTKVSSRSARWFSFAPTFVLLCLLFACLWVAGGASRANVLGQVVVRSASWLCLIALILFGIGGSFRQQRPILLVLIGAAALAMVQLVSLPPTLWSELPGRHAFNDIAPFLGVPLPWRPMAISPPAALNALFSLIVPFVTLALVADADRERRMQLVTLLMVVVVATMAIGLLQFAGLALRNPLLGRSDEVTGIFSNRNHFALFMALGCLLTPVWVFAEQRKPGWRAPVAIGLIALFVLAILASGSRAGMAVGVIAMGMALLLGWRGIRRSLSRYPRWVFPAVIGGIVAATTILTLVSAMSNRAIAINRAMNVNVEQDMRSRGLPTVLEMVKEYAPTGSGLGGFDAVFRMHEPFDLLKPTFFNRAHNDFIEIVLDAGVPGLLLLLAAIVWWALTSFRAWRAGSGSEHMLPKLGSAIVLLVLLASVVDYPARTPIIMAVLVIAALWLTPEATPRRGSALRAINQDL
jgi:O-antigen ligase